MNTIEVPKPNHIEPHYSEMTADVVSAYVSGNPVPASELPKLIADVYEALLKLKSATVTADAEKPEPAVNPKRSVKPDHIVCLECGQKFKSLKRHIKSHYGLTPGEYIAKWDLSADYPMVAPEYAAQRSKLAREMGLGRKPRQKPSRKKK